MGRRVGSSCKSKGEMKVEEGDFFLCQTEDFIAEVNANHNSASEQSQLEGGRDRPTSDPVIFSERFSTILTS